MDYSIAIPTFAFTKTNGYFKVNIFSVLVVHLSMYCPTTPLGLTWGNGRDLTQLNVKFPMVGQTKHVKSPCKPQAQDGDLTRKT